MVLAGPGLASPGTRIRPDSKAFPQGLQVPSLPSCCGSIIALEQSRESFPAAYRTFSKAAGAFYAIQNVA